jgi:peptide/nickel transport system permease protein
MWNKFWAIILLAALAAAAFAPLLTPYNPSQTAPADQFISPPSRGHLLGTDQLGRDVLSRTLYGARNSLTGAALSTVIALLLGLIVGGLAGVFGDQIDWVLMRAVDIILALPGLLLALALVAVLDTGPVQTATAVGIALMPVYSRLIRAAILSVRNNLFIEASHALGSGRWRIIWKHLLPNVLGEAVTFATLIYAWSLLNIAALDYLGLGGSPSIVSWGRMLSEGQTYLRVAPWIALAPGGMLTLTVIAVTGASDAWRRSLPGR